MIASRGADLVPLQHIARAIRILRGQRVLLDAELAALYGVSTKRFNEQVRRNRERFPEDFMFQLSAEEAGTLRSQIATSRSPGRGGRRSCSAWVSLEVSRKHRPRFGGSAKAQP